MIRIMVLKEDGRVVAGSRAICFWKNCMGKCMEASGEFESTAEASAKRWKR